MNKGGIVERFCGDSRIAKNRNINHLLYLLPHMGTGLPLKILKANINNLA